MTQVLTWYIKTKTKKGDAFDFETISLQFKKMKNFYVHDHIEHKVKNANNQVDR